MGLEEVAVALSGGEQEGMAGRAGARGVPSSASSTLLARCSRPLHLPATPAQLLLSSMLAIPESSGWWAGPGPAWAGCCCLPDRREEEREAGWLPLSWVSALLCPAPRQVWDDSSLGCRLPRSRPRPTATVLIASVRFRRCHRRPLGSCLKKNADIHNESNDAKRM